MSIEVIKTGLPEVLLLKPRVFEDERGFFTESYNRRAFVAATGVDCEFVQDNHSRSSRGVLRGLHYQLPPAAQGKLVRVLSGEIFDVAVDIRRDSSTFGKWTGQMLSAGNRLQIWIPQGFAHGFLVLSEVAEVLYKTTDYYNPELERAILWSDEQVGIDWPPMESLSLSIKDAAAGRLSEADLVPYANVPIGG
jgi:dTDP-4-dehydrorhamnose 3,5-epimerase